MASLVVNGNVQVQGNMIINGNLELRNGDVIIYNGEVIMRNGDQIRSSDEAWRRENPMYCIGNKILTLDYESKKIFVNNVEIKNYLELGKVLYEEIELAFTWKEGLTKADFFNH